MSVSSSASSSSIRPMTSIIPVMNKLQDLFSAVGRDTPLALPQIVVIGSQSSGKSSVLEGLVGRDFLPRGTGIVTRRPLVLHLHNIPVRSGFRDELDEVASLGVASGVASAAGSSATEGPEAAAEAAAAFASGVGAPEWAEFEHKPGRKFFDFGEVQAEILAETERTVGRSKGIGREPIRMRIYSPHVLNLTLVDLPGMTRLPVGDQPSDIERQVREMCLEYVSSPSTIILAVSAANADIANSDALKLALEVDPRGERTVGVLTKLDLMDPGTDAADVLLGRVVPLRRGFVGVVNRSQRDLHEGVPMEDARRRERRFFERHPAYRAMSGRMGSDFLAQLLNQLLVQHARAILPDIKAKITAMLQDIQRQVDALGEPIEAQSRATQGGLLLSLISRFAQNFCDAIDGRPFEGMQRMYGRDIVGGARIGHVFRYIFRRRVAEMGALADISDEDIRIAIKNAAGTRSPLTVPDAAFESLVRRQVRALEAAGLACVDLVYQELQTLTAESRTEELKRFGELHERVVDVVGSMLRRAVVPTQTMVSNLIHIELAHINTEHPDFIGCERASQLVRDDLGLSSPTPAFPGASPHYGSSAIDSDDPEGGGAWDPGRHVRPSSPEPRDLHATPFSAAPSSTAIRSSPEGTEGMHLGHRQGLHIGDRRREAKSAGIATSPFEKAAASGASAAIGFALEPVPRFILPQLGDPTLQERFEIDVMRKLIRSYFAIAQKTFCDMVPKTIMCFLVNHAKENAQAELVRVLYSEHLFDELLQETDSVASSRRKCLDMRALLRQALHTLDEIRDFNVIA